MKVEEYKILDSCVKKFIDKELCSLDFPLFVSVLHSHPSNKGDIITLRITDNPDLFPIPRRKDGCPPV